MTIDDMEMMQLPKRSGEYLFEATMRRHDVRNTIMTSNRPLQEWSKLIGDVLSRDCDLGSIPAPQRSASDYRSELPVW